MLVGLMLRCFYFAQKEPSFLSFQERGQLEEPGGRPLLIVFVCRLECSLHCGQGAAGQWPQAGGKGAPRAERVWNAARARPEKGRKASRVCVCVCVCVCQKELEDAEEGT